MSGTPQAGALHALVARAARAATRAARPQWVAWRAPVRAGDLLAVFANAPDPERFFFERPSDARSVVGLGALVAIEPRGPERFAEADRLARALFAGLFVGGNVAQPGAGPKLVGGFGFADAPSATAAWRDFPPARLWLPELLIERERDRSVLTLVREIAPGARVQRECAALAARLGELRARLERGGGPTRDAHEAAASAEADPAVASADAVAPQFRARADRPHAAYRALVEAALGAIAAGDLEKVVVARSVELAHEPGFSPHALLAALRASYPSCASFAIARGEAVFLGATPERLLRIAGGRVETAAVAGSAPRGRSPERDAELGRALLESKKEQVEHAVVVRAMRAALRPVCESLELPEAPRLLRLEGIQHLETPIAGVLGNGASILELVGRLHPTPAVGGAPRDAALDWLAQHEALDRGWYAGPIGFADPAGGGEFCVALRAALLRKSRARLFAGAGIVAGSVPEAELRETRLKLRALLAPLLEV